MPGGGGGHGGSRRRSFFDLAMRDVPVAVETDPAEHSLALPSCRGSLRRAKRAAVEARRARHDRRATGTAVSTSPSIDRCPREALRSAAPRGAGPLRTRHSPLPMDASRSGGHARGRDSQGMLGPPHNSCAFAKLAWVGTLAPRGGLNDKRRRGGSSSATALTCRRSSSSRKPTTDKGRSFGTPSAVSHCQHVTATRQAFAALPSRTARLSTVERSGGA